MFTRSSWERLPAGFGKAARIAALPGFATSVVEEEVDALRVIGTEFGEWKVSLATSQFRGEWKFLLNSLSCAVLKVLA